MEKIKQAERGKKKGGGGENREEEPTPSAGLHLLRLCPSLALLPGLLQRGKPQKSLIPRAASHDQQGVAMATTSERMPPSILSDVVGRLGGILPCLLLSSLPPRGAKPFAYFTQATRKTSTCRWQLFFLDKFAKKYQFTLLK